MFPSFPQCQVLPEASASWVTSQNPTVNMWFPSTSLFTLPSSPPECLRCSRIFGRKKQKHRRRQARTQAYMMYTFSACEKWKTSLVLGQTTLSS